MSEQATIGPAELEEAASWLLGDKANGGKRLEEWAESRGVDLDAIDSWIAEEGEAALETITRIGTGELARAIYGAHLQGFITGIEAERRRRDAESLPLLTPPSDVECKINGWEEGSFVPCTTRAKNPFPLWQIEATPPAEQMDGR